MTTEMTDDSTDHLIASLRAAIAAAAARRAAVEYGVERLLSGAPALATPDAIRCAVFEPSADLVDWFREEPDE